MPFNNQHGGGMLIMCPCSIVIPLRKDTGMPIEVKDNERFLCMFGSKIEDVGSKTPPRHLNKILNDLEIMLNKLIGEYDVDKIYIDYDLQWRCVQLAARKKEVPDV